LSIKRRMAIAGALSAVPGLASAQASRKIVVGVLSWWPGTMEANHLGHLREGLRALGYVEGRNLEILSAFVSGDVGRAREAVRGYVERGVDVIVAAATPAATIAKEATATRKIPIVMCPVSDPLATGLAQSIARPGGNLTGMAMIGPDLTEKRLELLREIKPGLKSIAFIGWTRDQNAKTFLARIQAACQKLGLGLTERMIDQASAVDEAMMKELKAAGAEAVILQPIFLGHHGRMIEAARAAGLPSISDFPNFAEAGALFTFGIDDRAQLKRAGYFIDRIVKGTSPADLPIELPVDAALLVNLKTAREFGLTVPPAVLQRATDIIE
jgi:putative ABC transport system substrate-binding protein